MRRCGSDSAVFTPNGPVQNWGRLFGDTAVAAMFDGVLHHGRV
jgi:DNA replication protein DnaC